jgi:hypothetical protein
MGASQLNVRLCILLLLLLLLLLPAVFMDVSQNGKLLTAAACISRYPQLQGALSSHPAHQHQHQQQQHAAAVDASSQQIGWLPPEPEPVHPAQPMQQHTVHPPGVVTVWASFARSMVTAHQRRGESDFVAQWLFQLLALDSQAVEWSHVLR